MLRDAELYFSPDVAVDGPLSTMPSFGTAPLVQPATRDVMSTLVAVSEALYERSEEISLSCVPEVAPVVSSVACATVILLDVHAPVHPVGCRTSLAVSIAAPAGMLDKSALIADFHWFVPSLPTCKAFDVNAAVDVVAPVLLVIEDPPIITGTPGVVCVDGPVYVNDWLGLQAA